MLKRISRSFLFFSSAISIIIVFGFFPIAISAQLVVPDKTLNNNLEKLNISTDLNSSAAADLSYTEEISNYNVKIEIKNDSSLIITENILYDFKSQKRHGIYRDIPIKYKDQRGANYNLRLKVLSITDEKGMNHKYTFSRKGKDFSIKIGDPDKYVSGKKTYIIKYKVDRGMRFFSDYDELYWNAIGHGWNLNILAGKAEVVLPKETSKDELKYDCFTGKFGAKDRNCKVEIVDNKRVDFLLTKSLPEYSGMTIVLGIPKGIVAKSASREILWFLQDNWPLLLIPISFLTLFCLWWRRGRDPKGRGTIIAQYEPPDRLRPGEVGVIFDQDVDNKDISSTLIDLAVRGYLKIKEIEKGEYQFTKLKEGDDLENYEKELFDGIFGNAQTKLLSALKNKFANKFKNIKDKLYEDVTRKGYFPKNPELARGGYFGCGIVIGIAAIILGIFLESWVYLAGFLVAGVLMIIFSFFMSRRSYKGVLAYEHILGFKEFLSVTERERLKFHQAPEKKPELFEKYLPYAMALGVEGEWARQFEGIYQQKSSFYESYDGRAFAAYAFVSSLNSLSSQTSQTFTAVPKTSSGSFGSSGFGGGGFSGGGGGGGGGGSW
ncbi:MAG: DUF2207 domain-containing protein [Patescibacteria group bacterium]